MNIEYVIIKNPLYSVETGNAPYVGQCYSNGTSELENFCRRVAQSRPNLDANAVALVVKLLFAVIADEIGENNYRCVVGDFTFESAISGSLPSVDAALSEENALYVAAYVGGSLRRETAAITPKKATGETTRVSIQDVEDESTQEKGVIKGSNRALITGRNISGRVEGESVTLEDPLTGGIVSTGTVVDEDGYGQRVRVNFPGPFAAGRYVLVLSTRGYDTPTADVVRSQKNVSATAAAAPAPTLTSVHTEDCGAGQARVNMEWRLEGTLLGDYDMARGDSVTCHYLREGVESSFDMSKMTSVSATCLVPEARLTSSCDVGSEGRIVVVIGGTTLTQGFTVVE